jgi:hypothetical protein
VGGRLDDVGEEHGGHGTGSGGRRPGPGEELLDLVGDELVGNRPDHLVAPRDGAGLGVRQVIGEPGRESLEAEVIVGGVQGEGALSSWAAQSKCLPTPMR